MADENAATTMVGYYASSGAALRGRAVYVQYSNHRELKTDQAHSNAVSSLATNTIVNKLNVSWIQKHILIIPITSNCLFNFVNFFFFIFLNNF